MVAVGVSYIKQQNIHYLGPLAVDIGRYTPSRYVDLDKCVIVLKTRDLDPDENNASNAHNLGIFRTKLLGILSYLKLNTLK